MATLQKRVHAANPRENLAGEFESRLQQEFNALFQSGAYTKRSSLRVAIINTLEASALMPGDLLPAEQRLAQLLDASLGTVQVALKQLVDRGYVSRRRGDGTRVLDRNTLPASFWHVRVVDPRTGSPLQLRKEELVLDTIVEDGPWTSALGLAHGDLMIRRTFVFTEDVRVAQEIYFSKQTMQTINALGPEELRYTNIRETLLPDSYSASALQRHQMIGLSNLPDIVGENHRLMQDCKYLELQARVFDESDSTLYIQRIFAPADQCGFET
jgi:DNA-binding GntR family transcriptional regulator|tara:strand:+ start:3765 stop:4574 length:810 start_codon:yes stop_codon:yes gene_type:complete